MSDTIPIPDLGAQYLEYLRREYKIYPVKANRSSALGHPCLRYLTYLRTQWQHQEVPTTTLMSIFAEGNLHEKAVTRVLADLGYQVVEQQRAFEYPEHLITGMLDGFLVLTQNGVRETLAFDIKSCSSYVFKDLNTIDDLVHHKYVHVQQWRSQLVMYCLLASKPRAALILKEKQTGLLKIIEVPLDYDHAEELLRKADAINAHVAAGTLPDRIPYDQEICGKCMFFAICLPDEALRAGATLTDDPELEGKLRRRAELEQAAREFGRLDEEIKKQSREQLGENGEAIVGVDWIVRTSTRPRKGYAVEPGLITSVKIERLGKSGTADA